MPAESGGRQYWSWRSLLLARERNDRKQINVAQISAARTVIAKVIASQTGRSVKEFVCFIIDDLRSQSLSLGVRGRGIGSAMQTASRNEFRTWIPNNARLWRRRLPLNSHSPPPPELWVMVITADVIDPT